MEYTAKGIDLGIFWVIHLITLGLWGLMMLFFLSVWLKSRVPGAPDSASRWRKLGIVVGHVLGVIFSRRLWLLLRAFLADGLLQRRLLLKDRLRWGTHMAVFGSFFLLGIISIITGVVIEFLPLFGMTPTAAASLPIIGPLYHADVWSVALINEVLGLILLVGMAFVLYRRFVRKDPQLRINRIDNLIVFLLTTIAITGFLAEAFRLLANYTTPAGVFAPAPEMLSPKKLPEVLYPMWGPQWGFVGYGLAALLALLKVSQQAWVVAVNVMFWLHFVAVTALLFYFPFSRFAHALLGPIIVSYNTMRVGAVLRDRPPPARRAPDGPLRGVRS